MGRRMWEAQGERGCSQAVVGWLIGGQERWWAGRSAGGAGAGAVGATCT
jgi:hypothetical protein